MEIFECRGLTKRYGAAEALGPCDLKLEEGGVVGLLGPNGSGKTTLLKLAMGMLPPTEGEILIDGKPPCPETRKITSYLPDANYLIKWMRVEEMLAYLKDFFPDFRKEKAMELLDRLGIGLKQKIRTLSKGNQEKLGLIFAMSREAKLYLLDEPIAGVDPAARDFILDVILKNRPEGSTILLCTHLISDIESVLSHAIFLNRGKIVLNEPAEAIRAREGKSLNDVFREVFKW